MYNDAAPQVKAGTVKERVARRAEIQPSAGRKLVAEYWLPTSNPQVITVFEADSMAPIMESIVTWGDVFDITIFPALTAEEGLQLAKQMPS